MITQIEEGQKLKDGDYFFGTTEEYNELLKIENHEIKLSADEAMKGLVCDTDSEGTKILMLLYDSGICISHDPIEEYSFEAYKQLCINTFGTDADN